MHAKLKLELKKPTRASRNNLPIIIAKDKNINKSTFIEETNKIFKELPSNIKQEMCTISSYSFKDKLMKYVSQNSCKSFKFPNLNILLFFNIYRYK